MNTNPSLLTERDGAIVTLKLNRPDVGNALDIPLARSLMEAAITLDEDDSVRCVVLTGVGRMFCAGGDVGAFSAAGDSLPAMLKEITAYLHAAITRFARMNKPLVTAINGPAAGAGFSLALLGDIAIAARSAHFTLAYTALGLTPDGGSTWLLPRLVGMRRAQELIVTNKRVSAEEAVQIGMMTRVVDDTALASELAELTSRLATSATPALGLARNLLLTSFGSTLEAQMEFESRSIAEASRTRYGKEGVAAFVGRRKPDFS